MLDIDHIFPLLYLTICIAGVVSAVIVLRIPPQSRIPDTYYTENDYTDIVPNSMSKFKWGLQQATERAEKSGSFKDQIKQGTEVFLGIAFVLIPQVMAIGTIALIVAEYTPFFEIISKPMVPILSLLQIPEAAAAAPATIVGFIDMFIPAEIGRAHV